jgi:hypothetical protein
MAGLAKHFDPPSLLVITITAALFMLALLVKGLTHDMLLEAGVLMISIKLVLMAYKNSVAMLSILTELKNVRALLERQEPAASEAPRHSDQRR